MIETSNGIIFEGVTADEFETTLRAIDPTADRTIELPDAGGTVALTSDLSSFITSGDIPSLVKVDDTGDYMTDITVSGHTITEVKESFSTLTISTGLSGTSYKPNAATTISLTEITPSTSQTTQGALWYHGTTPEAGKFDGSTAAPIGTTRLNYGGYLYATRLYSGGNEVYTSANLPIDPNTTYSISTEAGDNAYSEKIRLTGSDASTDDVILAVGAVDTIYGLTIEETGDIITFKHANTSSQVNVTADGRKYVTGVTLDTYGHVTGLTTGTETVEDTDTTYSLSTVSGSESYEEIIRLTAGGDGSGSDDIKLAVGTVDNLHGLTISETGDTITFKHADTSSINSSDNSGRTYIQNITLDTYGHITGLSTATETVVDTDTDNFIDLIDTPSAYPSNTDDYTYFVKVKSETEGQGLELEFTKELNCGEYTVAT
jgi:hypothetical protein